MTAQETLSPALLAVLPLVGGYAFNRTFLISEYFSVREQGHRLYFRALFYGAALFAGAFLARLWLLVSIPAYVEFESLVDEVVRKGDGAIFGSSMSSFALVCAYSLALGPVTGVLLSAVFRLTNRCWPVKNRFRLWLIRRAIKEDDIECLLFESVTETRLVRVSLQSRKEYIGYVLSAFDPQQSRRAITLLPLASGYRDDDQLELFITNGYWEVFRDIANESESDDVYGGEGFRLAVPVDQISTVSFFDFDHYVRFQGQNGGEGQPSKRFRRVSSLAIV